MNRTKNNNFSSSSLQELIKKRRRYPVGEFTFYDDQLLGRLDNSPIDFENEVYQGTNPFLNLNDIPNLEYLQDFCQDKIESLEAKFEEIEANKNRKRQQMVNTGKRFKDEKTREEIELEANLDVRTIEKEWVLKRLKNFQNQEEQQEDTQRLAKMKKAGLGNFESINHNTGRGHIGYMLVQPVNGDDGVVCIVDKISPYDGMSVLDFREFVLSLYRRKVDEIYEQRTKAWKGNGKEGVAPSLRKIRPPWPAWPKGVKNYLVEIEKKK